MPHSPTVRPSTSHVQFSDHQPHPLDGVDENLTIREVFGVLRLDTPLSPLPTVPKPAPSAPRPQRTSGLYAVLHAAQQFGITHPQVGGFLQLPREFDAILALEHKSVAQVVLEVLRQTVGKVGDGREGRQEWARISKRHFARTGLMTDKAAQRGLTRALEKRYIVRRQVGARSYEYAIRWRGTN